MSGHGVTDQDIPSLVHTVRRLRETTYGCGKWDDAGIVIALRGMLGWNFATAHEQILRRATDPEARTPKAMLHTVSSALLPSERPKYGGPAPQRESCPKHPGQSMPPFCGLCNVDRYGAEPDAPRLSADEARRLARHAARAGRA